MTYGWLFNSMKIHLKYDLFFFSISGRVISNKSLISGWLFMCRGIINLVNLFRCSLMINKALEWVFSINEAFAWGSLNWGERSLNSKLRPLFDMVERIMCHVWYMLELGYRVKVLWPSTWTCELAYLSDWVTLLSFSFQVRRMNSWMSRRIKCCLSTSLFFYNFYFYFFRFVVLFVFVNEFIRVIE